MVKQLVGAYESLTYFGSSIAWTRVSSIIGALGGSCELLLPWTNVFLLVVDVVNLAFIFFCCGAAG